MYSGQGFGYRVKARVNAASDLPQSFTLTPTVGAGSVASTYTATFSIPGISTTATQVSTSFSGTHTVAGVNNALAAAINNDKDIFQYAFATSSATNVVVRGRTANTSWASAVAVASAGTAGNSLATSTVSAAVSGNIPFGVFVGTNTGDRTNTVRVPSNTNTKIVGVSMATHAAEKTVIGPTGVAVYPPNQALDVMDRTGNLEGIWVRAVESDITTTDTLCVSVAAATAGFATKTTGSSTISLASRGEFASNATTDANGQPIVLVSFNSL